MITTPTSRSTAAARWMIKATDQDGEVNYLTCGVNPTLDEVSAPQSGGCAIGGGHESKAPRSKPQLAATALAGWQAHKQRKKQALAPTQRKSTIRVWRA